MRSVWNRAVADDDAWTPEPAPLDPMLEAALRSARERLRALAWSIPLRRRHALLLVGHAILARMARVRSRRVPVPERDLVLDTGLADRKVIRAQLRLLHGPLGSLVREAFDPARSNSSFEFEIPLPDHPGGAVSQIPPPSRHTPSPTAAPGILDDCPQPPPTSSERSCRRELPWVWLISWWKRNLFPDLLTALLRVRLARPRQALVALLGKGLVVCDEDGSWSATEQAHGGETILAAGSRIRAEHAVVVEAERAAWRSRGARAWNAARAAAAKRELVRQRQWWSSLPADERIQRREAWRRRFDDLGAAAQQQVKSRLVARDRVRGVDPARRYREWIVAQDPQEMSRRSTQRAVWFAALAPPLQVAYAQAWEAHRRAHGIPRAAVWAASTAPSSVGPLLPDTRAERDENFLQQQLPGLTIDDPECMSSVLGS